MKQYTIETPDGYKAVETKVDNGILIRFVEEEKYEPKEGDICALDFMCSEGVKKLIFCLKSINGRGSIAINYYFGINGGGDFGTGGRYGYHDKDTIRPATPEEQKQLFDALAKAGKMWNGDKKEIVDVPKKGDILKWTGINKFVGVFLGLDENFKGRARVFDPKREYPYRTSSCWIPYLVEPTESEKQECLANLKRLGKRIDENGDIVDVPKLLVPDNVHIWRSREDFGYDQLFIGFNEDKQLLGYNPKFKTWVVYPNHEGYDRVQCELVEVKREELKDGDLCFRTDRLNPNVFRSEITNYAIIDGECDVWIDKTPTKGRLSWGYWYKLIQING